MLRSKIYLILGIGTEIGKTFLVENLLRHPDLVSGSILPLAIKPIASGFCDDDKNSDTARIAKILGEKDFDKITPWRFKKPVSPHFAGKIDFSAVKNFCRKNIALAKKQNRFLFIEAAGGVMTPITDKKTFLDLACDLKIPVLLVSANYLGSISHTLCAIMALKAKKIFLEKIIINENFPSQIKTSQLVRTCPKSRCEEHSESAIDGHRSRDF
ncbi:MAG: dethiobiotin synthase, partial [Alphaproteobacteria bacterium RIFCSPHIGHO2_01_FULL_40_8]